MIKYDLGAVNVKYDYTSLDLPSVLYIKLTKQCMLNCKFCSQNGNKNEEMPVELIKKILDFCAEKGIYYVNYTGGEPLMYSKIEELLDYGYKKGIHQILTTNGILLDKYIESINKVISIGVSLHGPKEIHDSLTQVKGSYDKACKNIELIRSIYPNLKISINYTCCDENLSLDNVEKVYKNCLKNNFELTLARINYIGRAAKYESNNYNNLFKIIYDLNKKYQEKSIKISNCIASCLVESENKHLVHGCSAGNAIAAVETNGDVKICASSINPIGNLYEENFEKIWKNQKMKKFKKFSNIPIYCKVCKDFITCKGGCKAERNGKFWNNVCDEEVYRKYEKIWKEIEKKHMHLTFNKFRKENNNYSTISFPIRIVNDETINIISKVKNKTGYELLSQFEKYKQTKIKELLVAMYVDGLLRLEE